MDTLVSVHYSGYVLYWGVWCKSSPSNYRPISLLLLISKVLERIVYRRISNFLYSNSLLSNCQFGFKPRSSTQEALLSVIRSWFDLLSKHRQDACVFFEVKRALLGATWQDHLISLQHRHLRTIPTLASWLPVRPSSKSCSGWCSVQPDQSHLWGATGLDPRTSVVQHSHELDIQAALIP